MKNSKKKLLLSLITGLCITAFAGCSGNVDDPDPEPGSDWRTWMPYECVQLTINNETVDCLVAIYSDGCKVYYNQESQVLIGKTDDTYASSDSAANLVSVSSVDIEQDGTSELVIAENRENGVFFMVFSYDGNETFIYQPAFSAYNEVHRPAGATIYNDGNLELTVDPNGTVHNVITGETYIDYTYVMGDLYEGDYTFGESRLSIDTAGTYQVSGGELDHFGYLHYKVYADHLALLAEDEQTEQLTLTIVSDGNLKDNNGSVWTKTTN